MAAKELKSAIVSLIKGMAETIGIPAPQIREAWNVDGEPVAETGIVVNVSNEGDHFGNTNGVLIDCRATVTVYTHVNEDATGVLCDSAAAAVMQTLRTASFVLPSYTVAFNGKWTATAPASSNGTMRSITLSAIINLNKTSSTGA